VGDAVKLSRPPDLDPHMAAPDRAFRRPLVCEFVGLPGAGKTSAAANIVQQLRARGSPCGERRSLGRGTGSRVLSRIRKTGFQLTHLRHFMSALWFGMSVRPPAAVSVPRAYRVANWAVGLSRVRHHGFNPVILDQGIVQELWSVTLTGSRWSQSAMERVLKGILREANLFLVLVYLDVGVDVAAERIRRRPPSTSRFDRLDPPQAKRLLTSREATLKRLFDQVVTATAAPWCRVDGERSIEDVSAEVIAFLDSVAEPCPDHPRPRPPQWRFAQ
jgi:thymidylate kinase